MPQRHRGPLSLPTQELVRIQGSLNPYESTLSEDYGVAVFIARVPENEPDLVNDLERIAELAAPSHVERAEEALVLTPRDVHTIPLDPIRRLMEERVGFDSRHAQRLRQEIHTTNGVRLFRAADDPKRRLRLAIRIAQERVADLDDDDLLDAAESLGGQLESAMADVHCVYLIASCDHVRLQASAILPELLEKWNDPARRERLSQERMAVQMEMEQERQDAKKELDNELRTRFAQRIVAAPVKTVPGHSDARRPVLEAESAVIARPDMNQLHRNVDALDERIHAATQAIRGMAPRGPDVDDAVATRLERLGYVVRLHPQVPGHRILVAAERAQAPRRVIVLEGAPRDAQRAMDAMPIDAAVLIAEGTPSRERQGLARAGIQVIGRNEIGDLVL